MNEGDQVAGRYRLESLHGHGPMSELWRAHDETLDRTVALKMLSPTADLERFRREARSAAALAHENVTRVFDYGEDEGGPYLALEWLPGGTLEERLADGSLPDGEAHRVATGIAAGLAHLHERGLMHRDLKPANVLFDAEDRPKLADFGLARSAEGAGTLTEAGTVLGTAAYLSPEQAGGEPASPASDVYSFGVVLFRMLTGALPFVADDALTLIDMHRRVPPPAIEDVRPDVPPALAALTMQALAKDPADRPADGAALLTALGAAPPAAAAVGADTQRTRVVSPAAPPVARRSRRGAAVIALALLALAGAGGLLAWVVTRPAATAPAGVTSSSHGPRREHPHRHQAVTSLPPPTTAPAPPTTAPTHERKHPTTTTATTTAPPTTTAPTTAEQTTTASTTVPATTTTATTTAATTTAALGGTTTGAASP